MSEKKIKARLQQKHDTSANWALATNFKPKAGELIIYDDLKKMKVGDGETLVNNLPFLSADVSQDLNNYVNLAGNQTISGAKTFTGDTTVHGGTFKVSKTDSANKTMSAVYGANAITYTPYGSTSQKLISLPSSDGTIALTKDIPSISNLVTTNTDQTISGVKTFTSGSIVASKTDSSNKTMKVSYGCNGIAYTPYGTNSIHIISFPAKDGTFALTSDIPNLTNYVTVNTAQTISGIKTFNAPTDVSGKETITTKFKTSNGGALIIGKEGQNSGTMLRFDQVDGTCRLRFRSSATAGSMVWEQPEKNAVLYFDMGNSTGSGKNRVTLRNVAGTLALTKELPAAVSANPTLSGSETELTGLQIGSTKYKIPTGGGGDVTAAGNNTFTGKNTFTYGSIVVSKTDFSNKTMKVSYGCNGIAYTPYGTTSIHIISFPGKDGTFALTSDIDTAIGNIDTLLTALNSGTGV